MIKRLLYRKQVTKLTIKHFNLFVNKLKKKKQLPSHKFKKHVFLNRFSSFKLILHTAAKNGWFINFYFNGKNIAIM